MTRPHSDPAFKIMNIREYEITIGPTGEVELHIDGIKGKGCLEVVKLFESLVGEVREVRHTSSFFEPDDDVVIRNQQHH